MSKPLHHILGTRLKGVDNTAQGSALGILTAHSSYSTGMELPKPRSRFAYPQPYVRLAGSDGARLKGADNTAQGNALGILTAHSSHSTGMELPKPRSRFAYPQPYVRLAGSDGARLKGVDNTAQGNALGIPGKRARALKGRHPPCKASENSRLRIDGWHLDGRSGFALSGLGMTSRGYPQGVVLGFIISAFQAADANHAR